MPIAIPFAEDEATTVLVPNFAPDGSTLDEPAAIEQYKKTGKHLGKFDTPANANSYAEQLSREREGSGSSAPPPSTPARPGPATLTPPSASPAPAAPAASAPAAPAAPAGAPAAAAAPAAEPSAFQQRWADVESRLPPDRPDLLLRAQNALRTKMNAEYADELHLRQTNERAQKEVVKAGENDVIADAFSAEPKITAQDVSVDKRFDADPEARLRMLALKTRLAERPPVDPAVSNTTMHELMRGITAGDIDRSQVIDAFNAKPTRLSEGHFNFLLKQLDDIRTPEGLRIAKDVDKLLQAAKGSITKSNPLMGHTDASGDLQFGAFEEDVRRGVEVMKRDKKSAAEISDWLSVKRFRDNPALLEPYQKTIQQSIQDQARSLSRPPPPPPPGTAAAPPAVPRAAPGSPVFTAPIPPLGSPEAPVVAPVPPDAPAGVQPRLPGESPGDYMKRTGGGGFPGAPRRPAVPAATAPIPPP